jgi:hypothetical protein
MDDNPSSSTGAGFATPKKQKIAYSSTRESPSPDVPLGLIQIVTIYLVASGSMSAKSIPR